MTPKPPKPKLEGKPRKRSNKARGTDLEKRAQRILEAWGYKTHRAVRTSGNFRDGRFRGGQNNDVFGCFDLLAAKDFEPIRFVQVTTKEKMRERERKVQQFAVGAPLEHCDVEVWGFVGGRRPRGQLFRITRWNGHEWAGCRDVPCVPGSTERAGKAP